MKALFKGVAIIIDDEYGTPDTAIMRLNQQIVDFGCHVVGLKELPEQDADLTSMRAAAFFVLDWNLYPGVIADGADGALGVALPAVIQDQEIEKKLAFLRALKEKRSAPVFIFTNADPDAVIQHLSEDNSLYIPGEPSHIFVKKKSEVEAEGIFEVLDGWIKSTPSALALKLWEEEYEKAKSAMFYDFYSKSVYWPVLLWKTFDEDGLPASDEIGRLISRNLLSRMTPFQMDMTSFVEKVDGWGKKEPEQYKSVLMSVLEGERFVRNHRLHEDSIGPGDVFKSGKKFLVNIRPDCDCVSRDGKGIDLYLLEGSKLGPSDLARRLESGKGVMSERDDECVVFGMFEGASVAFKLKVLTHKTWDELKEHRIGRLVPPFSTRIQQRYSAYLQRLGLPKIPSVLVPERAAPTCSGAQATDCAAKTEAPGSTEVE